MPTWSLSAICAACFVAAHYLTLRAASGRIGDALGAFCLEASATLGLAVILVLRITAPVPTTWPGLGWSVVSGLCISGVTTLLFAALRHGGPVAATGTIVLGGGMAISALCAPLFFGEELTPRRVLGVVLGLAAMALLASESKA